MRLKLRAPTALGILLFWLAVAPSAGARVLPIAAPEAVGMSAARLDRIRPVMQAYVDAGKLPGVITVVARRGKVVHFEQLGMMDLEGKKPMRPDTIFRIYSMTKPITGVAVMSLHEEGRFLLTDPVSKFLPELEEMRVYTGETAAGLSTVPARPMTIRHLLTHTSGLSYDDKQAGVPSLYSKKDLWSATSLEEFMKRLAPLPLMAQPGTEWHYGVSMDVLGRLVEVVSGEPFDRFLAERVFEPLGMVDTAFHVPDDKLPRFAANYDATSSGGLKLSEAPHDSPYRDPGSVPYGGHGLVSTAADYMRFALMLAGGGELEGTRILGRKTIELMMMDHLGPEFGEEPLASASSWLPTAGMSFGLTGSVIRDVARTSVPGSVGAFAWGGAASTYFWVDRQEDLVGLLLTQLMPSDTYPIREEMRVLTYQAIVD